MPARMSARDDDSSTPVASNTVSQRRHQNRKRRTPRACDRCRLKKAKCDGRPNCHTCKSTSSVCGYTARRGREARDHDSYIRNITEEALLILYRACQRTGSFPGKELGESDNRPVTTHAILHALGLIGANIDDRRVPRPLLVGSEHGETACPSTVCVANPNIESPITRSTPPRSISRYPDGPMPNDRTSEHSFEETYDESWDLSYPRSFQSVALETATSYPTEVVFHSFDWTAHEQARSPFDHEFHFDHGRPLPLLQQSGWAT